MNRVNLAPLPALDSRHRRVPQDRIVDMLMLHGCAFDVDARGRSGARSRCLEAVETWIVQGLGFAREANGQRLFDPVEVICFVKWSGAQGHDRFWKEHWIKTARAFVEELSDTCGPAQFNVELTRTFDLRHFDAGKAVRLRLPLPLKSAYHQEFTLKPLMPGIGETVTQAEGRLEVRLVVPDDRIVTIGADIELAATLPTHAANIPPLDAQDADLYLRAAEDLIRVTPRVRSLAAQLAENKSPQAAANAFWNFMLEKLQVAAVRYDELTPETAVEALLDGGWCDCQLGAALFISLCRAHGLPARMLGGYFLYRVAPSKHYWAEVWIEDRWLPFDCFGWDLSQAGRDINWRDRFAANCDYRMVTECFPRLFTGPMSVRFPPAWQMLEIATDRGSETVFSDVSDGSLIYRDTVAVSRVPDS